MGCLWLMATSTPPRYWFVPSNLDKITYIFSSLDIVLHCGALFIPRTWLIADIVRHFAYGSIRSIRSSTKVEHKLQRQWYFWHSVVAVVLVASSLTAAPYWATQDCHHTHNYYKLFPAEKRPKPAWKSINFTQLVVWYTHHVMPQPLAFCLPLSLIHSLSVLSHTHTRASARVARAHTVLILFCMKCICYVRYYFPSCTHTLYDAKLKIERQPKSSWRDDISSLEFLGATTMGWLDKETIIVRMNMPKKKTILMKDGAGCPTVHSIYMLRVQCMHTHYWYARVVVVCRNGWRTHYMLDAICYCVLCERSFSALQRYQNVWCVF